MISVSTFALCTGHLFSRYRFFCFSVFQFVLDVGPIHLNGSKGLVVSSVSLIFSPRSSWAIGTEKKTAKKPAAFDFQQPSMLCNKRLRTAAAHAVKFDRCRLCKSVWRADHYGSIDSLIDDGC